MSAIGLGAASIATLVIIHDASSNDALNPNQTHKQASISIVLCLNFLDVCRHRSVDGV